MVVFYLRVAIFGPKYYIDYVSRFVLLGRKKEREKKRKKKKDDVCIV